MDNQHRAITGYRELSQDEIDLVNEIKAEGERLQALIERVGTSTRPTSPGEPDPRWVNIARTHFQEGLMALTRAVTKPTTF